MQSLQDISQFNRNWSFGSRQKQSTIMPAWALDGYLLTGFDLESPHPVQEITELKPDQATELFVTLYPKLSWPEAARFVLRPGVSEKFDLKSLTEKYGFRWDSASQKISHSMLLWPAEVQDFLSEKDIKPVDVQLLNEFSLDMQKDILSVLVSSHPSKSLFCQILELVAELILMGQSIPSVLENADSPAALEKLKALRYPTAAGNDQKLKAAADEWPSPKGVNLQVQRRGDLQGIEFKFFLKSPDELDKTLRALSEISNAWKKFEHESDSAF